MRKVAVIGSSGAIGNAFLEHYIKDESVENIFSFSRSNIFVVFIFVSDREILS